MAACFKHWSPAFKLLLAHNLQWTKKMLVWQLGQAWVITVFCSEWKESSDFYHWSCDCGHFLCRFYAMDEGKNCLGLLKYVNCTGLQQEKQANFSIFPVVFSIHGHHLTRYPKNLENLNNPLSQITIKRYLVLVWVIQGGSSFILTEEWNPLISLALGLCI